MMEGLKIQEDHVENKMNNGRDNGGRREDVSDSKITKLGTEGIKIQEDYASKTIKSGREVEEGGGVLIKGLKINDDCDIGGQREDESDSKRMELGIDRFKILEEYLGDIHLEKITESGISNDPGACIINIEGLKQKLCTLISETKWLHENDKDNEKYSLINWIKILKATKVQSVELGTELCFMLVELRFIMSEREELMAKFQAFKASLEFFFKDENVVVINKIIEVLEMADGEMRKMNESKMVKNEKLEERVLNVSEVKGGLIEVRQIDHLLVSTLNEVLNLRYVLMHQHLHDLKMSKKNVICLEELKAIDTKIAELKESSTVIFGLEEMKRVEFHTRPL